MSAPSDRRRWFYRVWSGLLPGLMAFFIINIGLMVAAVATNSFGRRWLGTWLPEGYTTQWYLAAWKEFQLGDVLWVTAEVVLIVVVLSIIIGVPAAYALARRQFRGKQLVTLLFILPLIIPPITYGIPMATVMYQAHLGGTLGGVILANLVPALPFVILVMTPFIEQIDPTLESAARVFGGIRSTSRAAARHAAGIRFHESWRSSARPVISGHALSAIRMATALAKAVRQPALVLRAHTCRAPAPARHARASATIAPAL